MQAGIVGLPNVGKSTLFNALTSSKAAQAANYPFCTIDKNEGMVSIPDNRLARISKYIVPKKLVPTAMRLVDIAGIVKGASDNLGLGNKFLSHIREVDAILQVVRCFEDPNVVHVAGEVNPLSDVETVEIELMLADMQSLEESLPRAERTAKSGDKEALLRVESLKKCQKHLAQNEPLRKLQLRADEKKALSSFGFLTAKPILYVANVDEHDLSGQGPRVKQLREYARTIGASAVHVCAKLEAEIAELSEADRAEMLHSLGVQEPALAVLARTAYAVLGLETFFTAGEKEVRAWTYPKG
ncbi:MAG TPA: redox-regulated ATPase YchF, partial [Gemmatales bacterium]|nr:redox-regulated ATPase YchF [Gemmatales bacterium]